MGHLVNCKQVVHARDVKTRTEVLGADTRLSARLGRRNGRKENKAGIWYIPIVEMKLGVNLSSSNRRRRELFPTPAKEDSSVSRRKIARLLSPTTHTAISNNEKPGDAKQQRHPLDFKERENTKESIVQNESIRIANVLDQVIVLRFGQAGRHFTKADARGARSAGRKKKKKPLRLPVSPKHRSPSFAIVMVVKYVQVYKTISRRDVKVSLQQDGHRWEGEGSNRSAQNGLANRRSIAKWTLPLH